MSLVEFVHETAEAARRRHGFSALQTIRAAQIEVEARVRVQYPETLSVSYEKYKNPLALWTETLGAGFALMPDDLVGATLSSEGRETWHVYPKGDLAVCRPGRVLGEPLPGVDALGEIGFLTTLARDVLVRDAGEQVLGGRACRAIGIKPKRERMANLLRVTSYPFERARLLIDVDSKFPREIRFVPSSRSPLRALLGDGEVEIRYDDPHELSDSAAPLVPPDTTAMRVFREVSVRSEDVPRAWPFRAEVGPLHDAGYELAEGAGWMAREDGAERGYAATVWLAPTERSAASLTLRVGNYLSREMARRRSLIADQGSAATFGTRPGRLLDRAALWPEGGLPPDAPHIVDATWENEGTFWILSGDGLDVPALVHLAASLASA
ncbi:MAG: hypothetical protein AB1778_07450 [Candidatus Bipolaricaulota bacterium]